LDPPVRKLLEPALRAVRGFPRALRKFAVKPSEGTVMQAMTQSVVPRNQNTGNPALAKPLR